MRKPRWSALSQKLAAILLVVIVAACVIGWRRYEANGPRPPVQLQEAPSVSGIIVAPSVEGVVGRWMASGVATPVGPLKIELVLRKNGSCHLNVWTCGPIDAQLKNVDGTYVIRDGRLCSHLLKSGGCQFWMIQGKLLVEYKPGKIVVFRRELVAGVFRLDGARLGVDVS